jgi:hypothetical protein
MRPCGRLLLRMSDVEAVLRRTGEAETYEQGENLPLSYSRVFLRFLGIFTIFLGFCDPWDSKRVTIGVSLNRPLSGLSEVTVGFFPMADSELPGS